jgi:hypothetical protein
VGSATLLGKHESERATLVASQVLVSGSTVEGQSTASVTILFGPTPPKPSDRCVFRYDLGMKS